MRGEDLHLRGYLGVPAEGGEQVDDAQVQVLVVLGHRRGPAQRRERLVGLVVGGEFGQACEDGDL